MKSFTFTHRRSKQVERGSESKQPPEVQDSCARRTCLRLHEPIGERILPALHWAAAIGVINLIYNPARCEQIVRLKLLLRAA